jgi:hypothetical protein
LAGATSPGSDHEGNTPPIDGAPERAITAGEPVNAALTSADILHNQVVDEIDFHLAADRDETVIGGLKLFGVGGGPGMHGGGGGDTPPASVPEVGGQQP